MKTEYQVLHKYRLILEKISGRKLQPTEDDLRLLTMATFYAATANYINSTFLKKAAEKSKRAREELKRALKVKEKLEKYLIEKGIPPERILETRVETCINPFVDLLGWLLIIGKTPGEVYSLAKEYAEIYMKSNDLRYVSTK